MNLTGHEYFAMQPKFNSSFTSLMYYVVTDAFKTHTANYQLRSLAWPPIN